MLVRGDNQGELKLAESVEHHRRSKHIDVRCRFLRDVVENGSLQLECVITEDNVVDALTKALFGQRFERLHSLIGSIMRNKLEWECWYETPNLRYRFMLRIIVPWFPRSPCGNTLSV